MIEMLCEKSEKGFLSQSFPSVAIRWIHTVVRSLKKLIPVISRKYEIDLISPTTQ